MPEVDQLELKAEIGRILNRWPAVGLAVGVGSYGRLEFFHGHGFADIASNTPRHRGHGLRDASAVRRRSRAITRSER
jgi:hypothetical protein